jgi:hypothetical protein
MGINADTAVSAVFATGETLAVLVVSEPLKRDEVLHVRAL